MMVRQSSSLRSAPESNDQDHNSNANTGVVHGNIDLNIAYEGNNGEIGQSMGTDSSLHQLNLPSSDSSNPHVVSSQDIQNVDQEIGKRKAPDEAESSDRQVFRPDFDSQAGNSGSFPRNTRLRIAENQQDIVPACMSRATSVLNPRVHSPDSSGISTSNINSGMIQPIVQSSQRNWTTGSGSGGNASMEEENSRLIQRNTSPQSMLVSEVVNQAASRSARTDMLSADRTDDQRANRENLSYEASMTREERQHVVPPFPPLLPPIAATERRAILVSEPSQRNWITGSSSGGNASMEEENSQLIQRDTSQQSMLISEAINRAASRSARRDMLAAARADLLAAAASGDVRAIRAYLGFGLPGMIEERQNAAVPPITPLLTHVATRERRATFLSAGGWIEEDSEDESDMHEDMRLDVDDMSYEELLFLEEQIGHVNTGLSEEAIISSMKRRTHQSVTLGSPAVEKEPCCICQEEFMDGQELGRLDCVHDFHFECIKPWLLQKNSCPICKKIALATKEKK